MGVSLNGRMKDKVVLISGAAQGIGAAAAQELASEGAIVVVTDVQADKVVALGAEIGGLGLELDARDEAGWTSVVQTVERKFGRLDALVNNVGFGDQKLFWEFSLEELRRHFELNFETGFLGSKTCLPLLEKTAAARDATSSIVHIASIAAVIGAYAQMPYNITKAAVVGMSRTMAIELARSRKPIRSNAILPGLVDTAILRKWFVGASDLGMLGEGGEDERWATMSNLPPMGRLAAPTDIAKAIVYLASDDSSYTNGAEIRVDGAWTAG